MKINVSKVNLFGVDINYPKFEDLYTWSVWVKEDNNIVAGSG